MTKKYFSLAMTFLILLGCQPKKQEEQAGNPSEVAPETGGSITQLTDEQKADGWKLLFDGESTEGWKFYKGLENDSWEVSEGTLHCKPFDDASKRSDIMTVEQYENFELAFDWKISAQGNSGVMFRVAEDHDQPYQTGPEYQVIDDEGYPGDLTDLQLTAGSYDMYTPDEKNVNPVGEWNSSKIVATGNLIEHWLNDKKVLSYEIGSEDWKSRKEKSKWKEFASYGMVKKGHIDFQDHGNEVWFKSIMIKSL